MSGLTGWNGRALAVMGFCLAGAAGVAAQTPTGDTKVDASRGGVTMSSGVNSLSIGARLQVRWTLDDRAQADADTDGSGEGEPDGPVSQFDVPRLRVTLSGGAFRPWLRYLFQFEMSRTGGDGGSRIKDAVFEIRPTGRNYRLLAGQFKAPFGLQQITSSGRLQFVDRAITDAKFTPGRDMGVMFGATTMARKIGYDVGLFNGSGESIRQNNRSHLWAGRVYFNPLGVYTLSESASDAGANPVLHIGLGAHAGKQIRGRSAGAAIEQADPQAAVNLEFAFKGPRFYSTAEYFWMTDDQQNPVRGRDIDSRGFHAQAGYMVVPKMTEIGVLVAQVDGDTDVDESNVDEVRVVVGYYWQAHNLKLQADIGRVGYDANFAAMPSRARQGLPGLGTRLVSGRRLTDTQVRVQVQVAF